MVGTFSMQVAIDKAKETGVGWVAAHSSNHYGIAGMYSIQAVEQGLMVRTPMCARLYPTVFPSSLDAHVW